MQSEEELRKRALERVKKKRDLFGHVVAYVIVNAFLIGIWYFTSGGYFWPGWVLGGWGIGLAFNVWDVYGRREITEEDIQKEMDGLRGR